jgi:hypothetical protein
MTDETKSEFDARFAAETSEALACITALMHNC